MGRATPGWTWPASSPPLLLPRYPPRRQGGEGQSGSDGSQQGGSGTRSSARDLEWTASIPKTPNQQTTLYAPDPFRSADHDPLLLGVNPRCGDLDDDGDVDARDLGCILDVLLHKGLQRARRLQRRRPGGHDLTAWLRCEIEFNLRRFIGGE